MSEDRSLERSVGCLVNGTRREARISVRRTLADYLRHDLGLTGTHLGCEHGVCGACTVLVDGQAAVNGQLLLASSTDGRATTTDNPGQGVPATETHFKECGHVLQAKTGGTNVLARCLIHFN